jgi:hypothetical protein
MKNFNKAFIVVLMISLNLSCGKDEDSESSSLISSADLQGTWNGECRQIGETFGKTSYSFIDSTFTHQSSEYADSKCVNLKNAIVGRGTYLLSGDLTSTKGVLLAGVDYEYSNISWSFYSEPSSAKNWSIACDNAPIVNNSINLLGKVCTNGSSKLNFSAESFGTLWFNDGKIYLTDFNSNGSSVDTRSESVDTEFGALTKVVLE